jgi:predicted tellurium resistance membrane protein TerC
VPIRTLRTALWGICAAVVVLAILIAAAAGLEPSEDWPLTALMLVLAVIWLAHEWHRLWDEERRGRGA